MTRIEREPVGPGQESVWDYPRPPRLERVDRRIRIELGGVVIVDTSDVIRVLETSHPPIYYLPIDTFVDGALTPAEGSSFCEFKGTARMFDVHGGSETRAGAAWQYPRPTEAFAEIADRVAVYPRPMDRCTVGDAVVTPQPGQFYGGWITPEIVGPFKGAPGTRGW